jgi:hypothetical protein
MDCKCKCSCHNIKDISSYIDLYNTLLALEIVRGEEYTLKLGITTDITTLEFDSQYFSGSFIKYDEGDWRITLSKADTKALKLGIYPYTIKANGDYLYTGTMNVIDSSSSISSTSNTSSEINKMISPRFRFELKSKFDSITQEDTTLTVVQPFTKKNKDLYDALSDDLLKASNEHRLYSLRLALIKPANDSFEPYTITQDIEYDADKISAEFYYVDDYINGCNHLLFNFTNDKLSIVAKMDDDYFIEGGTKEKFAEGLSKLFDEYKIAEFTLIMKKSSESPAYSCDLVAGEGISINKDGIISGDFDEIYNTINTNTDALNTKIDDEINDVNTQFNKYNHLYKSDGYIPSSWESGDGYLIGYKGTATNYISSSIKLGFDKFNAYSPYVPTITGTYYTLGNTDSDSISTKIAFASTTQPFVSICGSGNYSSMGARTITLDSKWYDINSDEYTLKIPATKGTLITKESVESKRYGVIFEFDNRNDFYTDTINLKNFVTSDKTDEDEKEADLKSKALDLEDSIFADDAGGFTLTDSSRTNYIFFKRIHTFGSISNPIASYFSAIYNRNESSDSDVKFYINAIASLIRGSCKINIETYQLREFTADEKTKLSTIESGANKTIINNTLTSGSITEALSANQGKELKTLIDSLTTRVAELENALNKEY